jgi:hypothetical protein
MEGCINIHTAVADGNFRDESGNIMKPLVAENYNTHTGYVDKNDQTSNSYGISRRT